MEKSIYQYKHRVTFPTSQKAMVNTTNMNMFAHTEIKVRAGKAVTIECDMTSRID